jgi:endonuclease III
MTSTWREGDLVLVSDRLSQEYADPRLGNKDDPLDELIFIILSARTAESGYSRTYRALRDAFHSWFDILGTPEGSVARIISSGGLAEKKERQIRSLLQAVRDRTERKDLSFLQRMSTEEAEGFLTTLPGVGLKTARCVLMYSMGRNVFPVDTHVRRVLSRLGFVRYQRLTSRVQDQIQQTIPVRLRYKLHVNLVAHGRAVCTARRPSCERCILNHLCDYYAKKTQSSLSNSS